jgi:hypothetical protein
MRHAEIALLAPGTFRRLLADLGTQLTSRPRSLLPAVSTALAPHPEASSMWDLLQPKGSHPVSDDELRRLVAAYKILLRHHHAAQEQEEQPQSWPLPWQTLRLSGIDDQIFQWLLYQDHAEHFRQLPGSQPPHRFEESPRLHAESCLVLTDSGERFGIELLTAYEPGDPDQIEAVGKEFRLGRFIPHYADRTLTWGRKVVKAYAQSSSNQDLVLRAAEELGWPPYFDDPLPRVLGMNPKVRLHDTIKSLNRYQKTAILHFQGDGTGTRIGWNFR